MYIYMHVVSLQTTVCVPVVALGTKICVPVHYTDYSTCIYIYMYSGVAGCVQLKFTIAIQRRA